MNPIEPALTAGLMHRTRRHFLRDCTSGLGALWLASLTGRAWGADEVLHKDPVRPLLPAQPQFPGKARRVIYLHMAGSPSQLELFDHKPELAKMDGKDEQLPQVFAIRVALRPRHQLWNR